MQPLQLTGDAFAKYPPQARKLAVQHLDLIRRMPLAFAALLMREVRVYDWLFPAERRVIESQIAWLQSLSPAEFDRSLQGFAAITLSPAVERLDWVHRPEEFLGALTAELWSTHQIDGFRQTANVYNESWSRAYPEPAPAMPRLAIVVLGGDLRAPGYPLFRKLHPHGVLISQVDGTDAWPAIMEMVAGRVGRNPQDYGHWYIDGGARAKGVPASMASLVWAEMDGVRAAMLARMRAVVESGHGGPEELRTLMAETTPRDVGMNSSDEVLDRFRLSILAEGSGTQIFSTTFVQWTAREALRRAQPSTLLLHFQPRQRQLPMNELLAGTGERNAPDPEGSLIDADMGAYYTWIDQQRLTGTDRVSFVAWSEAHSQAVVIGPNAPRGAAASGPMTMRQIFTELM
jgi:hypothetical protein